MSKLKLVGVKFPPQMGYRSGKVYQYLWDGEATTKQSAVVMGDDGIMTLVKVVSVDPYKKLPYTMKWLVTVIDLAPYLAKKDPEEDDTDTTLETDW